MIRVTTQFLKHHFKRNYGTTKKISSIRDTEIEVGFQNAFSNWKILNFYDL